MKLDYEISAFKNSAAWRKWLSAHYQDTDGVWVQIFKKASETTSINHAEALDQALCFGWIDGQRKGYDEVSFLQKFTPRRKKSLWSKRNIEIIGRLTKAGLMTPAGLAEVESAKLDGRWAAAYDRQSGMKIPDYFLVELNKNPNAKKHFETLGKSSLFAIGWRLQTATTDAVRQRRQEKLLALLEKGEKI